MENVIEDNETKNSKLNIWKIFAYFIIYSIIGYIIETVFAFAMYGVIESRQSFMYGPFCSIYGLGAVVMISTLRYFDKNNYTLFIAGYVIGSIVEYLVSWLGEIWVGTRWWDYSNRFLNINGRICLTYSMFWGLLAIYLMRTVNPKIDSFIVWLEKKIGNKLLKIIIAVITVFMFFDCLYSATAEDWVLTKVCVEKNLNIKDKDKIIKKYEDTYSNEKKKEFVDKYWTVEKILYAYPNLTKKIEDGDRIFIRDLYPEIHPYLYKRNVKQEGKSNEQ